MKAAALKERCLAKEASSRGHDKIGRNERCPCGCGLKYKKCCGRDW
ncbi:SEC-C metal-binding domain-containing protein [Hydrocarboniphaga sp.]